MNYKIAIVAFLFLSMHDISAQTEEISSYQINWKGIEKWYADSTYISVISFVGAQYPTDNRLPYFNKRIGHDNAFLYQVEVKNEVYTALTNEESTLINSTNTIENNLQIVTDILHERGSGFLDIRILPFVNQQGKTVKLQSFDLTIKKIPQLQKIATATRRTYALSSVLAQGKFVKIRIENSGIYKLTYEDLVAMGINPANVRVFGYGGALLDQSFATPKIDDLPELAIYMNKGADGVFNAGDYILFYGQGVTKWVYDRTKSMFTHAINSYSKFGYYFVTSDAGSGKKITDKAITLPPTAIINPVQEFSDYQVSEKELINLSQSGKEFYGEIFDDVTSHNLPFSFPNSVLTSPAFVRMDVAATSAASTSFSLTLNGTQAKALTVKARSPGDNYTNAVGASGSFTFSPASDTFNFDISYNKSGVFSIGYLNFLEVNVRRQLRMTGSAMQFQNVDYLGKSTYNKYLLSDANANVQIWDITNQQNISSIPTQIESGKLTFVESGNNLVNYIAIDPTVSTAFPKPEIIGGVANQNLHSITQADLVILTHPRFLSQAETLAQAHREKDNLTVSVLTTDQVYNEFSSGTPDATAYRWVMKMLYDRALNSGNTADLPKSLLLFGKGSYDNRNLLSNSGDNLILTYETENSLVTTLSYVTDDYFTLLDDNEGANVPAGLMDVGVGRLSVSTGQQV